MSKNDALHGYWDPHETMAAVTTATEWLHVRHHLWAFARTSLEMPPNRWRSSFEACLQQATRCRARLQWETVPYADATEHEESFVVRYRRKSFGILLLAPEYLATHLLPTLRQDLADLCASILALMEHQTLIRCQLAHLPQFALPVTSPSLTVRERDVFYGLVYQESEAETARRLTVETATIHSHRQRLYRRLNVHTAQEAVLRGFELGLIDWHQVPHPRTYPI